MKTKNSQIPLPKYIDFEIRLILVRHGESVANQNSHFIGGRSRGTELSVKGIEQAKKLGRFFLKKRQSFDRIYCSPLVRTVQTANFCLGEFGCKNLTEMVLDENLIEFDQGRWEGLDRSLVYSDQNKTVINQQKTWFCPPEGESFRMLKNRATKFLEEQIMLKLYNLEFDCGSENPFKILVFGHGIWIKSLLMEILGLDQIAAINLQLDNCSITELKFDKNGWSLCYLNRICG